MYKTFPKTQKNDHFCYKFLKKSRIIRNLVNLLARTKYLKSGFWRIFRRMKVVEKLCRLLKEVHRLWFK